jgi:hypothetical protein
MVEHEHRHEHGRAGRGATAEHEVEVGDERLREHRAVNERQSTGVGRFLGGVAKAGLWMVLGVIVAIVVLLALIF